jgi:hypothetical protein
MALSTQILLFCEAAGHCVFVADYDAVIDVVVHGVVGDVTGASCSPESLWRHHQLPQLQAHKGCRHHPGRWHQHPHLVPHCQGGGGCWLCCRQCVVWHGRWIAAASASRYHVICNQALSHCLQGRYLSRHHETPADRPQQVLAAR